MRHLLDLALPFPGRPGTPWAVAEHGADAVPAGERLVGLAVVAVLILALFA